MFAVNPNERFRTPLNASAADIYVRRVVCRDIFIYTEAASDIS